MKYSLNDIRSLVFKYYQYFLVGVLFVVLVIVLAVFSKKGNVAETKKEADTAAAGQESAVEVPDVPFEVDKYPAVNEFMLKYFKCVEEGDTDTLATMVATIDEKKLIKIKKKADFMDSVDVIACYTKPGLEENSYVAYTRYDIHFTNIQTPAPGLMSFYLKTNEAGELYIYNGKLYGDEKPYVKGMMSQPDVVDLMTQVDIDYSNAIKSDEWLARWAEALPDVLDKAVSEELVDKSNEETPETEEKPETPSNAQAKVKETVNVRKSASKSAEALGKVMAGDSITVIANLDNGWSQVEFQGQEAFVKTEFLEIEGEVQNVEAPEGSDEEQPAQTETPADGSKITVKGTQIRIRDKASKEGEILGAANDGDTFEKKGEEGDWYKIDYKGNTGYIKKEFTK